ncbi:hypothetical protein EP7_003962 [Isosphaeraceae bacterium EP7]
MIPLVRARRWATGTELGPALNWAMVAMVIGLISQFVELGEVASSGRPMAGQLVYLMVLVTFAALISVLNARSPGGGAWALLMGLLVLVMLVPWLEGSGLANAGDAWDRLRLDAPWTIFFGLLVLAGGTNHLPTKFGPSSLALLTGFGLEYLALTQMDWSRETRGRLWSAVPLLFAGGVWLGEWRAGRPVEGSTELERLWGWFRDHWGVAWALRVNERFGRTAQIVNWPFRLSWHGVEAAEGGPFCGEVPKAADATLKGLLRRFADPARLELEARSSGLEGLDVPGRIPGESGCEVDQGAGKSTCNVDENAAGRGGGEA